MSRLLIAIKCVFFLVFCLGRASLYYRWKALGFRLLGVLNLYERKHISFLKRRLQSGSVCIDVGAHFGIYSRLFVSKADGSGKVILVEPFPEGVAYLREVFAGQTNITISPCAVSDRSGDKVFLSIPKLHGLVPEPALASVQTEPLPGAIPIETVSIDELTKDLSRLDIIKADIEGYEARFFQGALSTMKRLCPLILFEDNQVAVNISLYRELERTLGYTLHWLSDTGELRPVGAELPNDYNFYFVPQTRAA